jgi:UDP-N-acetylmuramoylalanine--D-glutamate ligase
MISITTFVGKTVAVFGLARSGIVSAQALLDGGASVACWDDGDAGRAAASKAGLPLVDLTTADWSQFAALVLAPGVPLTHPKPHWTVEKAKAAGVEIIGDIELFFRERAKSCPECPVVAITGTNGKSTTTALIAHILKSAGKDVQMGGNIGVGVLSLAAPAPERYFVIEMSSFQIDLCSDAFLRPSVGVLLNITPDHLDRHGTMENYAAVKGRVAQGAQRAVIGIEDGLAEGYCEDIFHGVSHMGDAVGFERKGHQVTGLMYHFRQRLERTVELDGGTFGHETLVDLKSAPALRGDHNLDNAAAAFLTCEALGIPHDEIGAGLKSFPGLAHRLEPLGRVGRAVVVNDSKGTNADSTEKALSSFSGDIYWIAGGVPKDGGIEPLVPLFGRVAKAYLIGQCAPDFAKTLDGKVAYEISGTLETALQHAARDAAASPAAEPVILLSPACASYDQYKSFEHRGDHFRALAAALPGFTKKALA